VERRTLELTRAVQALKEIDRRKDNFLANVSHELRTPLVTVLGYNDLLLSGKLGELTPRQRECLQIATASGRRLRSFIEELLEFSRYELTREHLSFGPVSVADLLQQATKAIAPRADERQISVRARLGRGTPEVWGDREKLFQVLMNLLSNAERHCRPGGHLRIAAAPGGPGRIDVTVRDDGDGIPTEHLDRIFDRLYQVGDLAKQREGGAGLGLGLAIVKSIVAAHGGDITVRSQVGHGTAFRFTLPTAKAVPPQAQSLNGSTMVPLSVTEMGLSSRRGAPSPESVK
jgi:signal transduction histidine kinase